MMRRARPLAVVMMLAAGALGVISGTQTWMNVLLADGAAQPLAVPGSAALPVLTTLSLAVLALGAALSIVGVVLRYVFGALALVLAGLLAWLLLPILLTAPVSAVASTVTAATGIAGLPGVTALVADIALTAWPLVTLAVPVLLAAAGILVLATARAWPGGAARKYRATRATGDGSRPHDAIDSWDDLSRGDDPTR